MTAFPRIGLRQLLMVLTLAGIVPLAIVATLLLVTLWRTQQAQVHDATRATAHALAVSVEQRMDSTLRRLRRLAAQDPAEGSPDWIGVALVPPSAQPLFAHQKAVLQGRTVVSDLIVDGARQRATIEVGVPVLKDGKVAYGLFASLDADELSALLRAQLRDAAAVADIVDTEYRIVARTRDGTRFLGKPLIAPLDAAVRANPAGVGRFPVYDGPDVYSAWTRIGGTGWTLILDTPSGPADAALSRSLGALAALLAIVVVASGLFAWLIGRRITLEVDEARTLRQALERSSARLAAAQAERADAEGERDRVLAEKTRALEQVSSASRAKDEFLALLGHELRNPLGAIGNAVRVVERLPSSSADHKAARDIIARQTEHLARIVDGLLDVGRVVSGRIILRRNLLDLAQATAAAVATARAGAPAGAERHEWELDLKPVLVSADPTRIDQVLANLVGNAMKFTPAGGRITLRLRAQASEAVLRIEDTGPGIPPALLPHVFDLFSQHADAGMGIGLALVRRLVALHGGSVTAENRSDGAGAILTVRLPAIPEPQPAERSLRPLPSPRPSRQARVLIVEDNDDARTTLQRILQAEGHLVSAARDARAGLDAAMAGSPTIAIVDIGLPGMDGYAFARAMRERLGNGVRLIALTGYGTEHDRQRAAEAGFDAHLTKPVDMERLLGLLTN